VWLLCFVVIFPVVWSVGFAAYEWTLVGSVNSTYPRSAAFVTLVTGTQYVRGARVLAATLRMHNLREYPLIALQVGLSAEEVKQLEEVGWTVQKVAPIPFYPPGRDANIWKWVPEERLGAVHIQALTKMRVWEMDEYERIIFIDADAWTTGDVCAHLCRRNEELAAMGSYDINSGVMSLRPSKRRFRDMMAFWTYEPQRFFLYKQSGSNPHELPNPDQSLIVGYFKSRKVHMGPLSTRYNLNCRLPSDRNTRILHFNINTVKPWTLSKAEVEQKVREGGDELPVWSHALEWLELEEQVNEIYPFVSEKTKSA
jgi:lipopolysaccharide biosynthesis glycosyltransferase